MLLLSLLLLLGGAVARRNLFSTSLVTCMENGEVEPHYFDVVFNPDTRSLRYDISMTTTVSGYIFANVDVYAFGISIMQERINFCNIGWKQFCPMFPGSMEVESIQYLEQHYVDLIPNIAFTFPDIDAQVRLTLTDSNHRVVGCLQSSFSNGRTVSHAGAKWATAVVAGIGLLISSVLSLFGNSTSASRMSAMSISLFTYFQSLIIISMLHVQKIPPIAGAWSENLAWSMGLIEVPFMQKIFRWYVQSTGGTPNQYLTSSSVAILAQRSLSYGKRVVTKGVMGFLGMVLPFLSIETPQQEHYSYGDVTDTGVSVYKRADGLTPMDNVEGSRYLLILRGMQRVGYKAGIEPTSIVSTGITFFVLFLYVLVGGFFLVKFVASRTKAKSAEPSTSSMWFNRSIERTYSWTSTLKGCMLRYIYIGFPQLVILSLWEFTHVDSPAVCIMAVLLLLLALVTLGWACYRAIMAGQISVRQHNNAAAVLYGDSDFLQRYGCLYTMLDAPKYWFCGVILGYQLVKFIFVALGQGSGKTQAMACFLIDLGYTIYLGRMAPYLDRPTNLMAIVISSVITVNSFFFTFFSGIYNAPSAVASILGLIFFIMNAVFSLVLLVYILFFACVVIFSKNPDARFSPARDDRASFRRKHQSLYNAPDGAQELMALGEVARGHDDNWANEMYRLKNMVDSSNSSSEFKKSDMNLLDVDNLKSPQLNSSREDVSLGQKIKDTLERGKSILSRKSTLRKKAPKVDTSVPLPIAPNTSDMSGGHDTLEDLSPPQRFVKTSSGRVSVPNSETSSISGTQSNSHKHMVSVDGSVDGSLYNNEATTPMNFYKNDGRYNYI